MSTQKKKIIIFDFDGTLVDSMSRLADVASKVMAKHFGVGLTEARQMYLLTSGLPFNQQVSHLYPEHPKGVEAIDEFETTKITNYFSEPLFDDAEETLAYLKSKNYRVAISSNNKQELVDSFVEQADLHLDYTLGWLPNFEKGHDHFNFLSDELDCFNEDMIFVGDSLKDAERAWECRVDFIGKLGTFADQDFKKIYPDCPTVNNLSQLKDLF